MKTSDKWIVGAKTWKQELNFKDYKNSFLLNRKILSDTSVSQYLLLLECKSNHGQYYPCPTALWASVLVLPQPQGGANSILKDLHIPSSGICSEQRLCNVPLFVLQIKDTFIGKIHLNYSSQVSHLFNIYIYHASLSFKALDTNWNILHLCTENVCWGFKSSFESVCRCNTTQQIFRYNFFHKVKA